MKTKTLKNIATGSLVALLVSPIAATLVGLIATGNLFDPLVNQYALLQIILMGVYCIPAIAVSLIGMAVGSAALRKNHAKLGTGFLLLSILSSLAGIGLMISWIIFT